jgi:hypothetical protein
MDSFDTLLPPEFAAQMLAPSKTRPYGPGKSAQSIAQIFLEHVLQIDYER